MKDVHLDKVNETKPQRIPSKRYSGSSENEMNNS